MKTRNIEKALERAIVQAPSLDYEALIHMPYVKMSEHDFITRQDEKPQMHHIRRYSIAFSFAVIFLAFFYGWFVPYRVPDSTINLDVNPSIEIVTNRHDQVLSVKALNQDGVLIVKEQNNKEKDLRTTVSTLVTSIIRYGYLSTDKNVVLLSVENRNQAKADDMIASLNQTIQDSASSQNLSLQVLKQTVSKDKKEAALAQKLNISVGKLKLIQEILSHNSSMSIETLASMSVEELLAILEDKKNVPSEAPRESETPSGNSSSEAVSDHEEDDRNDLGEETDDASDSGDRGGEKDDSESDEGKEDEEKESRDHSKEKIDSKDEEDENDSNSQGAGEDKSNKDDSVSDGSEIDDEDASSEDNDDMDHRPDAEGDEISSVEDTNPSSVEENDPSSEYREDQNNNNSFEQVSEDEE